MTHLEAWAFGAVAIGDQSFALSTAMIRTIPSLIIHKDTTNLKTNLDAFTLALAQEEFVKVIE